MRQQLHFIYKGTFTSWFGHPYNYPPVITLIDSQTREEVKPLQIFHRIAAVEIKLDPETQHNGLEVWG